MVNKQFRCVLLPLLFGFGPFWWQPKGNQEAKFGSFDLGHHLSEKSQEGTAWDPLWNDVDWEPHSTIVGQFPIV